MSAHVIQVDKLGKRYRIGEHLRYSALRDSIAHALTLPARLARLGRRGAEAPSRRTVWALRDVSFALDDGDVVGVIGRNGAGKSTLLKILSRITEPTEGRAEVRGRVGSLLEVGTGFHPELTGRENVFLNGAILGMPRADIRRQFDEIVEFAGVERFVDTPVKRYSSGMQLRLAFAVAAHLDTDVLFVDEVLAVGDAAFQKRCLGKIGSVATDEGRTVLFVSHNMTAIREICPKAMWLEAGQMRSFGQTAVVIDSYLQHVTPEGSLAHVTFAEQSDMDLQVRSVRLIDSRGVVRERYLCDDMPTIEVAFDLQRRLPGLVGVVRIKSTEGATILETFSDDVAPNPLDPLEAGNYTLTVPLPPETLGHGTYIVDLKFGIRYPTDTAHVHTPREVLRFHLDDVGTRQGNERGGLISARPVWELE